MRNVRRILIILLLTVTLYPLLGEGQQQRRRDDKTTPGRAQPAAKPPELRAEFRALAEQAYDALQRAQSRQLDSKLIFETAFLEAERLVDQTGRAARSKDQDLFASKLKLYGILVKHCAEVLQKDLGMDLYRSSAKTRHELEADIRARLEATKPASVPPAKKKRSKQ